MRSEFFRLSLASAAPSGVQWSSRPCSSPARTSTRSTASCGSWGRAAWARSTRARTSRIHRKVAIKVLHAHVAAKADVVQRFEREAQAAGRIGSEHIVEVLDLGRCRTASATW
jgi:serine/threonine protein kinase